MITDIHVPCNYLRTFVLVDVYQNLNEVIDMISTFYDLIYLEVYNEVIFFFAKWAANNFIINVSM